MVSALKSLTLATGAIKSNHQLNSPEVELLKSSHPAIKTIKWLQLLSIL